MLNSTLYKNIAHYESEMTIFGSWVGITNSTIVALDAFSISNPTILFSDIGTSNYLFFYNVDLGKTNMLTNYTSFEMR